jgi:L-iditol 2-dehydrogenase
MKAGVWTKLGRIEFLDWPDPMVTADDVLVEVGYCGFCGSDANIIEGRMVSGTVPRVLGHEVTGVVASVGANVKDVRPGTAVACNMWRYCGRCLWCLAGQASHCTDKTISAKGFAQYAVYRPEQLYTLPEDVSLLQAVLVDPLGTCVHAAGLAGIQPGEGVLIIGGGALGMLMVQVAQLSGAATVVLSSANPERRQLAMTLGATQAVEPSAIVPDFVNEVTHQRRGFDVVFEAAGVVGRLQQALELLTHGGRLIVIGGYDQEVTISVRPSVLQDRELRVVGALGCGYSFGSALSMVSRLSTDGLITAVEPLAEIDRVYADHRAGRYLRAAVKP